MADLVTSIKARAEIHLNDEDNTVIELKVSSDMTSDDSYIRSVNVEEELDAINQNPVGVTSSNSIVFNIRSIDKKLIPENSNSEYFGYMNDTAIIKFFLEDSEGEFEFGTWYISKWYSTITSEDPFKITIEAYDILSVIFNNSVPNVNISDSTSIKDYLIDILNKLNENNDERHQIDFDEEDIIFDEFPLMQFSNLNTSNMSDLLNTISQATLTNIFIDIRDNKLKTDYCGDDTKGESVGNISDVINVTKASVDSGGLVGFSGVKVYYSQGVVNEPTTLVTLSGQTLVSGDNYFSNIELGNSSIYRNNIINITTADNVLAYNKSAVYNKNYLDLIVSSSGDTTCEIVVKGQTINESKLFIEKYRNNNGNNVLEINNRVLPPEYIEQYADEMIRLIGIKEGSIAAVGWINPRIGLSKTVNVNLGKSISTSGYYKTTKMNWAITVGIKCSASLIKTITE